MLLNTQVHVMLYSICTYFTQWSILVWYVIIYMYFFHPILFMSTIPLIFFHGHSMLFSSALDNVVIISNYQQFVLFTDADSSRKLREEFAKACFETLLQFSFISPEGVSGEGSITKLAVSALLQRCQDVLQKYVEDERLSGKCPLPR